MAQLTKYGVLVVLLVVLAGCAGSGGIGEDMLYVTRKYCGDFDSLKIERRYTRIYTSQAEFQIRGRVDLDVPLGARCYVRYIPQRLPGLGSEVWVLYFTWDGTADLYMLRQDPITGKIY